MKNFTHLHVHTTASLLDGYNKIDNMINKLKELNMNTVAITDHGTLAGTYKFHKKCKENNIKPILGIEMYYTENTSMITLPKEDRDKIALEKALEDNIVIPPKATKKAIKELIEPYQYDTKGHHIILLAKNQTGWNNLVKLSSQGYEKGMFNGKGHCDDNSLKEYSEGLICTTACIGSIVGNHIRNNNIDLAEKQILKWVEIFGKDNFFIELQGIEWAEQYKVNLVLIELAKKHNIKLIATNDIHYTNKEDHDDHDTLLCIGIGKLKKETNRMKFDNEYWIRSYDEMIEAFKRNDDSEEYINVIKEALENTNYVSSLIDNNIKIGSDIELLPNVDVPEGNTPETWISRQCWERLYKYLNKKNLLHKRYIYEQRLQHELNVIIKKGFSSYILIIQDVIDWGDKNGAPFGPGRGSAAGSLVAFLLDIVKGTDPVEYNLLFSRFLTMDRKAMPDKISLFK